MSTSVPMIDAVRRNNVVITGNPSGRTMLFAHGFGCSQDTWRLLVPLFAAEYRIILFDHVGAGDSDLSAYDYGKYDSLDGYASDVVDIVEQLDLRDVVFVAHSVSAMIAVLAAKAVPERFGALVLVGPSPRYVNDDNYVGGFEPKDMESLLDSLDRNYLGWSASMAPLIMGNPERPELGDTLEASFCSIDPAIARHFARVTFLSDSREDLDGVTTPTLILQCSDDLIAPLPVGTFVHDRIPGSTLVLLAATGHIPSLSAPDELAEAIEDYLA